MENLFRWLDDSTCSFLTVSTIKKELEKKNFKKLLIGEPWNLTSGGKYYVEKNGSAIFAFIPGTKIKEGIGNRIIAAHSDSPCLKLKPNPEIIGEGGVISLNVEKYGGGILYTWFDRPLSMSGRLVLNSGNILKPDIVNFDLKEPVAVIPHLAIHFNRGINEGNPISVQKDMKPVIGLFSKDEIVKSLERGGMVKCMIAERLGIDPKNILDSEIILYPLEKAQFVGFGKEYYMSGRIDDLSMVFAGLQAMLDTCDTPCDATRVLAIFDNEETGSATKQGAASPVLRDILERVNNLLGGNHESFYQSIENSFMISADDAHAWHPNYSEKYDPSNHPLIGGGPVIKINANGKYMTDAVGSAIFQKLCRETSVPYQFFVNHSDMAGGSTLGNISTSQMDMRGVDVGAPIWAMHSACETAGVKDHEDFVKVFRKFWEF